MVHRVHLPSSQFVSDHNYSELCTSTQANFLLCIDDLQTMSAINYTVIKGPLCCLEGFALVKLLKDTLEAIFGA